MRSMLLAHAAHLAANTLNDSLYIYETAENHLIDLELPYFKQEDLQINRTTKGLRITGETQLDVPDSYKGNKTRKIDRHIYLRDSITSENISAKLTNGVLRVQISKQPVTVDSIEISVE